MKIFPAIDLKENKCVRLSRGEDSTSIVFNENPVEQAKYFEDQGCKRLHLVDLDAAFGRNNICLLYTSPSPRDGLLSRMPSSA